MNVDVKIIWLRPCWKVNLLFFTCLFILFHFIKSLLIVFYFINSLLRRESILKLTQVNIEIFTFSYFFFFLSSWTRKKCCWNVYDLEKGFTRMFMLKEGLMVSRRVTHVSKTGGLKRNESPLKMMKNAFYFILKAIFVLKTFKCLCWLFGHVGTRARLERDHFKTFDLTAWLTNNYTTHIVQHLTK